MPAEAEITEGDEKRKVCNMGMLARGKTEEELIQKTGKEAGSVGTVHVLMSVCMGVCTHVVTNNQGGQPLVL